MEHGRRHSTSAALGKETAAKMQQSAQAAWLSQCGKVGSGSDGVLRIQINWTLGSES